MLTQIRVTCICMYLCESIFLCNMPTQIHIRHKYAHTNTNTYYTGICSYTNTYPCGTLCGAGSCTKEVPCSALRCVAVCYSVLQRVLVANTPLWTRFCRDPEFHVYKRGVLRCGIVCDIVLQCVAVCCSCKHTLVECIFRRSQTSHLQKRHVVVCCTVCCSVLRRVAFANTPS